MPVSDKTVSSYLNCLPAIFNEDPFLGRFLLAFEQILTGLKGLNESDLKPRKGLEEINASIAKLFNPFDTEAIFKDIDKLLDLTENGINLDNKEKEFLQWLASWTALSLRADWTPEQQRNLLANIVSLYQLRGTKDNLVELLRIYAGKESDPKVTEPPDTPFQINYHLQIGVNTKIEANKKRFKVINGQALQIAKNTKFGRAIPNFFKVEITLRQAKREFLKRQSKIVSALVDLQKPAHTYYQLIIHSQTIQIGNRHRSTINENMLLGDLKTYTDEEKSSV